MSKIALPYTIVNGDAVDAGPVQSNYSTIELHTNQELIERGGTVAMTAQLKLVGDPVAALDAAPKQYVDQIIPIGGVIMYGGTAVPGGGKWLLCDNTEYQEATYPELAAIIGAVAGRFRVPNLIDRFPVGGGAAYAHKSIGGSPDTILPTHDHDDGHTHPGNITADDNADHAHDTPDHLHSVPPLSIPQHNHGPLAQAFLTWSPGAGQVLLGSATGGVAAVEFGTPPATDMNAAGTVTGGGMSGAADRSLRTGGATSRHKHGTPALTHVGRTGPAGEAGAGKNIPPYFALAYIIRAL